ncbi:MAG: T9SS type A sorting domain-containing protein [Bacteroidota bacterium]
MKNYTTLLLIIFYNISFGQVQLGANINGPGPDSWFGQSVSISNDGTIVAIGAPYSDTVNGVNSGMAKVFSYNAGTWTQIGSEINGEGPDHRCGFSVALSENGNILAVGSHLADGATGKVRVYINNNGTWTQIGTDLVGATNGESFGQFISMSADGTRLAIASIGFHGNGLFSGAVRVYNYNMNTWSQIGSDLLGDAPYDYSGQGVALSGDGTTLAVGSKYSNANGADSGKTKIYTYTSGNWVQKGNTINGEWAYDLSGVSVSLSFDGSVVAIGAPVNNNGVSGTHPYAGHVRVFNFINNNWIQLGNDIDGAEHSNSGQNISISSDGTKLIIGGYNYNFSSGITRIFSYNSNNWVQLGIDINAEAQYDNCGHDVSMSRDGTKVAVGSRHSDANGTDSGHVRVFEISSLLSTNSFSLDRNIKIHPNPAKDKLFISLENGLNLLEINIFSALGQLVKKVKTTTIDVSNLSKGMYVIQIITDGGSENKKLIIE